MTQRMTEQTHQDRENNADFESPKPEIKEQYITGASIKVRKKPRVEIATNNTTNATPRTPVSYDDLPINSKEAKKYRKHVPSHLARAESTIEEDIATKLSRKMPEIWKLVEEFEPSERPKQIKSSLEPFDD